MSLVAPYARGPGGYAWGLYATMLAFNADSESGNIESSSVESHYGLAVAVLLGAGPGTGPAHSFASHMRSRACCSPRSETLIDRHKG